MKKIMLAVMLFATPVVVVAQSDQSTLNNVSRTLNTARTINHVQDSASDRYRPPSNSMSSASGDLNWEPTTFVGMAEAYRLAAEQALRMANLEAAARTSLAEAAKKAKAEAAKAKEADQHKTKVVVAQDDAGNIIYVRQDKPKKQ